MTSIHLSDEDAAALRSLAATRSRPVEDLVPEAILDYLSRHARPARLDQVLDEELPRYAEALERPAQESAVETLSTQGRQRYARVIQRLAE